MATRDNNNIVMVTVGNKADLMADFRSDTVWRYRSRQEAVNLVKKSWRSVHVECSAKYNWNVAHVFKELAMVLNHRLNTSGMSSPDAGRKGWCCGDIG